MITFKLTKRDEKTPVETYYTLFLFRLQINRKESSKKNFFLLEQQRIHQYELIPKVRVSDHVIFSWYSGDYQD